MWLRRYFHFFGHFYIARQYNGISNQVSRELVCIFCNVFNFNINSILFYSSTSCPLNFLQTTSDLIPETIYFTTDFLIDCFDPCIVNNIDKRTRTLSDNKHTVIFVERISGTHFWYTYSSLSADRRPLRYRPPSQTATVIGLEPYPFTEFLRPDNVCFVYFGSSSRGRASSYLLWYNYYVGFVQQWMS